MGNSDLRDVCYIDEPKENFSNGATAVVDGNNWLYKYITTTSHYTETKRYIVDGEKLPNLIGVPQGLKKFYERNISPVFVFDGGYEDLKQNEVDERKRKKKEAEEERQKALEKDNEIKAAKMEARTQRITEEIERTTKEILDILGIPHVKAPTSADSQASYMCREEDEISYMISDDYDAILCGSPYTIRNFTSSDRALECLYENKTYEKHDIQRIDLINLSILCGTDYNEGVSGVGPKTSIKLVKEYDTMENLLQNEEYNIENYKEIQNIFLNPTVKEDYKYEFNEPDIDRLREYLLEEKEIPERLIGTSLDSIDNNTGQKKLDSF